MTARDIGTRRSIRAAGLSCALLMLACSDHTAPTAPARENELQRTESLMAAALEPFTFRAPLDPYRIHQLPDFMVHSKARTDIVMQRSVFAPGPGGWHVHPGPSFVYVIEGQIKLQRFTPKEGCTETQVFGPNDAYFEVGEEVHRAVVVSAEEAVLLVTRFNIPVGGALSTPVSDPGC